jgi:hypothetical protein
VEFAELLRVPFHLRQDNVELTETVVIAGHCEQDALDLTPLQPDLVWTPPYLCDVQCFPVSGTTCDMFRDHDAEGNECSATLTGQGSMGSTGGAPSRTAGIEGIAEAVTSAAP